MRQKRKSVTDIKEIKKQEIAIIKLYGKNLSVADISHNLGLSIATVYNRIAKLKKDNNWPYDDKNVSSDRLAEIDEADNSSTVCDTQDVRLLMNQYIKNSMYAEGLALIDSYSKTHDLSEGAQKNLQKLRSALEAAKKKQEEKAKLKDIDER